MSGFRFSVEFSSNIRCKMKIGKYELGPWRYEHFNIPPYKTGYAWCKFAIINPQHSQICVAIYNWYSLYHSEIFVERNILAHHSEIWEPSFHGPFKFVQPIHHKAYGQEGEPPPLLRATENEAKVMVDERLERIANLIAFA